MGERGGFLGEYRQFRLTIDKAPNTIIFMQDWRGAFESWLAGHPSGNTRRAYRQAWDLFVAFSGKSPWQVNHQDVLSWVDAQRKAGKTEATIHQRLAALSSFYTALSRQRYEFSNPMKNIPMPKCIPYARSRCLSPAEARSLLGAIPRGTPQGCRDLALFLVYLSTACRSQEVRRLRWGDFEVEGGVLYCQWSQKDRLRRLEFPLSVWQRILDYLASAGRIGNMASQDFIFTSMRRSPGRPLSGRTLNRLLKKYCQAAGLEPSLVTVQVLRYTAVMLRREAGEGLNEISSLLGDDSRLLTRANLRRLEGTQDTTWKKVEALLV